MTEIERLARAACSAFAKDGNDYANFSEPFRPIWRECARAVLEALREPSDGLLDTLQASLDCVPINRCEQQATQVWQNGIDHILNELAK